MNPEFEELISKAQAALPDVCPKCGQKWEHTTYKIDVHNPGGVVLEAECRFHGVATLKWKDPDHKNSSNKTPLPTANDPRWDKCPICQCKQSECVCMNKCEDEQFIEYVVGQYMTLGEPRDGFNAEIQKSEKENKQYPKGSYFHFFSVLNDVEAVKEQREFCGGGA